MLYVFRFSHNTSEHEHKAQAQVRGNILILVLASFVKTRLKLFIEIQTSESACLRKVQLKSKEEKVHEEIQLIIY